MKNRFLTLVVLGLALGMGGYTASAEEKTPEKTPATKPVAKAAAINKICAVEGGDHTVDPDFYTMYKGMKIGFCCKDCIAEFEAEPEKFVAQLKARKDGIK